MPGSSRRPSVAPSAASAVAPAAPTSTPRGAGPRAMVIGLDGATWTLLDGFIAEGVMPTLARLRGEGVYGPLWSVIPPMTATAWTSYQTGKGPGKHGIYDWTEPVGHSWVYRPIDSTRIQSATLFEDLSARGKRVATVNLPLTFPARPIAGIAVGDMLTPSKDSPGFVSPPSFRAELDQIAPDYVIDTHLCEREDDIGPFLDRLRAMIEARGKVIRALLERERWDVFCTVWVEMDRMQHCLWHIFDPAHPRHDARLAAAWRPAILDIYRLIDTRIAEMIDRAGPDTNVYFISDHGFGPCRYKVFLNTWLAKEGFLVYKEGGRAARGRIQRARSLLDRAGLDTVKLVARARAMGADAWLGSAGESLSRFAAEIDWTRTRAVCHGTNAIRINLQGREPTGIVPPEAYAEVAAELRAKLLAMRDPEGNEVIQAVHTREELYQGPHVASAADVVIAHHDDSVWFYYSEGEVPERIFEPSDWASGNHKPDGLFCAWGPGIRAGGHVGDAQIVDILPTLYAGLGVSIPDDGDGRVLREVFRPELGVRPLYRAAAAWTAPEGVRDAASDAAIEARLRGLGYLQ